MKIPFIIAGLIFLGLVFLLIREIRRSTAQMKRGKRPIWPKRIRISLVVLLLLAASVGIWSVLIEPNRLVVHQQTIDINTWPKELSGLRIAVISDIHAGGPFIDEKKLEQVVAATNALNPDLIVLLGDYMSQNTWHGHEVSPQVVAAALKQLRAPLGVYGVLGNHDWWYGGEKVRAAFEAEGIRILEDEVAEVKWRAGTFWLVGLPDLWTRPQHLAETIAKVPLGPPVIALAHNPDVFLRLPKAVTLLLAGHTHGGQVKLPLIGTPVTPSDYGQRYAAGHIFENGHHLFVTTGIGTSIMPVRFRVPPEIVILTLQAG
jgi:predicted MPP superfamily phosphohydrolase